METKIIQLTAAKGPAECAWVVAKVLKIFLKELIINKVEYQILHKENGIENGTIQSVSIKLNGKEISNFLKNWQGTIQWIGVSTFRKYHKRKNWYIGCYELNQVQQNTIHEKEIQFQAIRSSGAGGQHVNKVSSAIRAKHLPTGIQVLVMDSRSQHQNKKIAVERLKEKVSEHNTNQLKEAVKQEWENHLNLERGNPIKIFTGSDFKQKRKEKSFKTTRNQLKTDLRKQLE
ncbi:MULTISPECIES: peptide chain release factor H [unclassified Tenacibaculum]|uniref:peptide chain release factor H n=1 Tax=unclassified Tenacibaculum TaxID=2635139 RepID=UPI001F1AE146|nr:MULTISPECIES: peptide chain release factor H [unclassified Tenacibaculum]MCF2875743.1 peptide chain release factor H [Tenacibaculum sp. Cn5-1]MCF2935819.1 peptide chain release factor H [Tenacibaculum sp. Cn5-34]MCG7512379.1 peptide chain release factor H [Tenacibaculum sp. Cn5-46]